MILNLALFFFISVHFSARVFKLGNKIPNDGKIIKGVLDDILKNSGLLFHVKKQTTVFASDPLEPPPTPSRTIGDPTLKNRFVRTFNPSATKKENKKQSEGE